MKAPTGQLRVRDYLHILARGWLAIVLVTALSAGVGWVSWLTAKPSYQASDRVVIGTPGTAMPIDAFYGQANSLSRALTYQYLVRSETVASRTIQQLGLATTPDELAARIGILPSASTVLDIVVRGDDPDETQATADAVTNNLIALSQQMASVDTSGTYLTLVDKAGPAARVGSMWRTIALAAPLGFFISALLVLMVGVSRGRVLGRGMLGRISDQELVEPTL